MVPAVSRSSIKVISVLKSSNRRPKWANAASGSPACHEPMMRSPAALISQTVPAASTRPKRCGSLRGAVTWWGEGPAVGRGPGRGPGRGTGTETGGAGSSIFCSSAVMRSSSTLCTSARSITAHPPRSAAPCGRAGLVLPGSLNRYNSVQEYSSGLAGCARPPLLFVVGGCPGGCVTAQAAITWAFPPAAEPVRREPGRLERITKRFHHRSTHMTTSRRAVA